MKKLSSLNKASNITNYQALNCNGRELGIVEDLVSLDSQRGKFILLSTHHKNLFGNIKYAVPFDLCDIDHDNKTIWLNIDKNELDFLYKLSDIYDRKLSPWDDDLDVYFNYDKQRSLQNNNRNMNI